MLIDFFSEVRRAGVPCSPREWLDLVGALEANLAALDIQAFYYLARACLVKDERHYDRFDRAFAHYFKGIEALPSELTGLIPAEWLQKNWERLLSAEERAQLPTQSSLEELLELLQKRLAEQEKRHAGGNKWIGTGGTSPFGAYGDHPQGIRIGQQGNRRNSAVKVWDKREFRDLDSSITLGIRQIQVALRKLRTFARQGAADELDLDATISHTAKQGGWLDIQMRPERHNAVKVLLFLDVGGSMDPYIRLCEELFSACRSEFKHLEYFYFHNCVYESVWRNNLRRNSERTPLEEVWRTYGPEYKLIFIGDAAMAPWEISHPGGSVEHWNEEAGQVWLERLLSHYPKRIWLNPMQQSHWGYTQSIQMISSLLEQQMYPLTLDGLEQGIRTLSR